MAWKRHEFVDPAQPVRQLGGPSQTAQREMGIGHSRAQRAQTARILTETTALPLSEIAFAAGFASIRQFNATIREVFAVTQN